ncbi:MAG TPA: NAD(P)-dependent oxidoreductase [Gemmatimonadota bacterium]|nr:NAD(P)-dependent oxidoreductase [Gemmatimonadota bacterium]
MRVVITGAAGTIGTLAAEELRGDHRLVLVDRRPVAGRDAQTADLSRHPVRGRWSPRDRFARWPRWFQGADVVLHLAAESDTSAPWRSVLSNNIEATWHVLHAAAHHRVPRVVFASSNWAVKVLEEELAPDCYAPDGPKIDSEAPPRPRTAYGFSKAAGEAAGRMFVDEGRLTSFLAVRIGWCAQREQVAIQENAVVRHRWLGFGDGRRLLRRCVEADFAGYHVVYGVSAQAEAPYDLSHTRSVLDWSPEETAPGP